MVMSFFEWAIKHLPDKTIPREDYISLGYVDWYDVLLVIEEWEFRIYNYEYWGYDAIEDWEHGDEDWYAHIDDYFPWMWDFLDKDTCEYKVAEFESNNPFDMAHEILMACEERLDDMGGRIYDMSNEITRPSSELILFMERWLKEVAKYNGSLVYQYYK